MTYSLVQQHAGPSWTEHDLHIASRSFTRVELQNRLAGSLFGKELGSLVAEKEIERNAAAAARGSTSRTSVRLRDARNIHARQRLRVFRKRAVGSDHQDRPQFVGIAGPNFFDSWIVSPNRPIGPHQQFNFGFNIRVHR